MKLIFPESQLAILTKQITDNPKATGVILTNAELVNIYDELLANNNSMCVLVRGNDKKIMIGDKWITIQMLTT